MKKRRRLYPPPLMGLIVEDGVYSGDTVEHILNRLMAKGVRPAGFVAGFAFEKSKEILHRMQGNGIGVELALDLTNPGAWHPDHDFFPFVPGSGRVIGFTIDGRHRTNRFPLYSFEGASYSFPYLPQFSYSSQTWCEWTGLPEDAAGEIGDTCMAHTIKLFKEIERLNDRQVCIGDLIDTSIRTTAPMEVGESDFPSLDQRVIDYLARYR